MPSQDNFFKVKTGLGVGTDTLYASVEDTKVTIGATTGNYELNVIGTIYSDYDVLVDNNVGIGTTLPFQRLDVRGIGIFSGSVGIGTTLPVQIFQVNGIGTQSVVVTGLGSFGIGTLDPYHPFQYVGVGNSNLVVITGIGSVGIGTSLPNFDVDLFGDARVTGFATITNAFIGVATVGFATITNEFVGISTIGFATITNAFIGVATVGFATITNEFVGISTIGFATITDAFIGVATVGFATITDAFIGVATVGFATITDAFIGVATVGFATITNEFVGISTIGFATITNEFVGISTIGFATITNEFVGISTINQLLVTGITTTAELDVGIGATLSIFGNFQITPVTDLNDNLIKNIQPIVGINTIYPTRTLDVAGDLRVRGEVIDSGNNVGFAYSVLSSNGNNIPGRFSDAANLLLRNKNFIASEIVGFITSTQGPFGANGPLFDYGTAGVLVGRNKCKRDIKSIIDSIAFDISKGGNSKVVAAGLSYYTGNTLSYLDDTDPLPPGFAPNYVKTGALAGISSISHFAKYVINNAVPPTSYQFGNNYHRNADASNLIKANKALIAEVAVARMLAEYSEFIVPNGNQHCVDDIIKVLEAVAYNVQFGYNDKVWDAAQLYVSNSYLDGEETESVYAFNQARDMAIQAMRNETITITGSSRVQVKDLSITVDLDSPTCANVASAITTLFSIVTQAIIVGHISFFVGDIFSDASNLIKANKALIAEVAVDRMLTEYSGFTVPNGNQHCVDDIIKVLEAVAYNVQFGYNDKVWDAANLYVTGAHVVGEENQSIYAFNQAKDMAIQAMRNETITITGSSRVQVKDATITVDSSSPTCANVASAIATLNSIVTQAISTGSISNIPRTLSDITPRTLSDITPRTSLARTSAEFDSQLFDFNVLPDGGSNTSPNGCSNVVSAIYTCVGIVTSIVDGGISAAPPINNPIGNLVWNPPGAKIGNEWFVNKLGSDENYGRSPGDSFLTIKKACSVAQPGDTVRVYTGLYVEDGPIQVPERVAVVGEDLRRTLVSTRDKTDLYYVKRGCYIAQQSFVGPSNPGKAMVSFPVQGFGFANGTEQNWQSPYIQNCTNFVPDSIGLRIDGARAGGFKSMVLDAFTQYNQGGIGVSITNFGYAQLVSLFTICCDIAVFCDSGGVCDLNNSNVSFGNFGLVSDGATPLQYTGTVIEAPDGDNVDGLIISVGIGASQEFIDSASLMILNKDFIAAEAVGFMTSTDGPFGIGATYFDYGGSSLGKSICIRDSKIIVESLVADLLNLGNLNSINAGLAYRDSSDGSLTYLPETSPPPGTLSYGYIKTAELALIDHIAGISTYIIQNINIPDTYQVGSPVADRNADASNLIKANKELIAEVAVGRMLNNYSEFIVPNGNQNCVDDIIKVLDAVAHNLKFGYNDKVWDAAQLYVSNSYLDGEETESIYAFNQARDMAIQAMRNETIDIDVYSSRVQVKDTTITVDPNSPTCTNLEVTITTLFSIITEVISLGSIITIDRSSGAGVLYQVKDLSKLYSPLANTFISSRAGIITSIIGIGVAAVPEKILPKGQRPYDGQIAYIDTQYYFVKEIIIDNPGSGYNPDIPVNVLVDFPPNPDYFIPAEAAIFETDVNFDGTISNISVLVSGTGYNEIPPTITIDAPVSGVRATGIAVMEKYFFNPLSSTPISVGSPVADRNADASNLIKANKELIAEVAVGRMLNEYSGFTVPNGNQNCVDDIIKVLDAVAHNLKFGYNDKVWDAAQLYISGAHVAGEETESVYAFNQARDMAIQAMRNETIDIDVYSSRVQVKDTTITVDPTPTCTDVASAITILTSIVTQAISTGSISDINRTYSDSGGITTVTFDQFITYSPLIGVGSTVYFFQSSKIIASGITFEFVGCGINIVDSIPSKGAVPIVENQIVPSNGGKVPFTSTDQGGNFRISEGITINQNTGTITGQAFSKSLQAEVTPLIIALQR